MRRDSFFVCSTNLTNATPASINGKPTISFYTAMIGTVQRFAGAETSSLFAEPVLPEGYSSNSATVSWYSSRDGNATVFASLDEVAKKTGVRQAEAAFYEPRAFAAGSRFRTRILVLAQHRIAEGHFADWRRAGSYKLGIFTRRRRGIAASPRHPLSSNYRTFHTNDFDARY